MKKLKMCVFSIPTQSPERESELLFSMHRRLKHLDIDCEPRIKANTGSDRTQIQITARSRVHLDHCEIMLATLLDIAKIPTLRKVRYLRQRKK